MGGVEEVAAWTIEASHNSGVRIAIVVFFVLV